MIEFSYPTALGTDRFGHAAALLSDGRVLLVRGISNDGTYLASAENCS
jgi:hypothetical protein